MSTRHKGAKPPLREAGEHKIVKLQTHMRRNRRTRALWARIFLVLFFMLIVSSVFMLNSELFKVKVIEIAGAKRVSADEINRQANIRLGTNILTVSSHSVEDTLMQNPLVKRVEVRRVIPTKVKISVFERQPFAYVQIGPKYFLIDDERVVLEVTNAPRDRTFKIINSDGAEPAEVGRRVEFPRESMFQSFFKIAKETVNDMYDVVRFNREGLTMILRNGAYVQLGAGEDMEEKLRLMPMLVQSLDSANQRYEGINLKSLQAPTFVRKPDENGARAQAAGTN